MNLHPTVVVGVALALSVALLASGVLLWLGEVRARATRVRTVTGRRSNRSVELMAGKGEKAQIVNQDALDFMRKVTQKLSIVKDRQAKDIKMMLSGAGYRRQDAIVVYAFFKLVAPVVFLLGAALYVYGLNPIGRGALFDFCAVLAGALVGSKLPDIILKNKRDKRMESIRKALPDSLDMLVICAEAGLASDAALKRVVAETTRKASDLGEELNQTALELSFMPERRQALENMADRIPLPSIRAFANTMIQAEKYGTPLARAFKVLSQEQRDERMMRAEEKAGRLPATMTVPMMIFILPALFVVLIGPAILDILDNFIRM